MNKKKILFLSPYPFGKAPSQRLKFEQYYPYFEEAGFELETSSFIDEEFWKVIYQPGNLLGKISGTLRGYLDLSLENLPAHCVDIYDGFLICFACLNTISFIYTYGQRR